MEQIVNYRFGDKYFVTEFIQPDTFEVRNVAKTLRNTSAYPYPHLSPDKEVELVSVFVRQDFTYPLDHSGNPATNGIFKRYRAGWGQYLYNVFKYYVWAFPSEVMNSRYGYCAETANLMTSILRALGLEAYAAIGEVRKAIDDSLLGYHAWTVTQYLKEEYLDETTIHEDINSLIPTLVAYDHNSDFAQNGGIYYVEHARYNEMGYVGTTQLGKSGIIFSLLGKPQGLLNMHGLEKLQQENPKKLYKAWRKEEAIKINMIRGAFQ